MSAATREVVDRALAANPNHPDLFELLAMDALRGRQFLTGARYLVRALGQPMADSRRRVLAETLALARARLDPQRPFIEATINIEGEPMPWLMVFARPADGGMPLAALRLPARKTQTVVLDAATSMDEAKSLASGRHGRIGGKALGDRRCDGRPAKPSPRRWTRPPNPASS